MNLNTRLATFAVLACSIALPAHAGTETRAVADFKTIGVSGSIDLAVTQGAKTSLQVQAEDHLLPLIETVVDGDRLQVRFKRGENVYTKQPVKVTVVTPVLAGVSLSGSGDATLSALNTEQLAISVAGSGDVRGEGKATKLTVSIAGSGDVKLGELKADEVKVSIAGSGDAAVHAQKTLNVSIAGSGDVVYSGEAVVKRSIVGSGSITKR